MSLSPFGWRASRPDLEKGSPIIHEDTKAHTRESPLLSPFFLSTEPLLRDTRGDEIVNEFSPNYFPVVSSVENIDKGSDATFECLWIRGHQKPGLTIFMASS